MLETDPLEDKIDNDEDISPNAINNAKNGEYLKSWVDKQRNTHPTIINLSSFNLEKDLAKFMNIIEMNKNTITP